MKMSSNSSSSFSQSPESLNGLNIGKKIYCEDVDIGIKQKSGGGLLSKKGGQTPRCQVEGCKQDLNDVKSYYLRHKVCGMHSKSPMVIVSGLKQRFCQQCSRFHQLSAFDQGKRSCRRRLAGHNKRQRKPPPLSLLSTPYANLSSFILENNSGAGGFLMDFTTRAYEGVFRNYLEHSPPNFCQGSTNRAHYPSPFIPP